MNSLKQSLLKGFDHLRTATWPRWRPWLVNSGASITFIVNPCHWRWLPWLQRDTDQSVWDTGPDYRGVVFGWLFLVVKVWVDNDSW